MSEAEAEQVAEASAPPADGPDAAEGLGRGDLAEVARTFAQTFGRDLGALLGPVANLSVKSTDTTRAGELDCPDAVIDQLARSEGEAPRTVHLLCPVPDALGLGALQAGLEADAVEEARSSGDFAAHAEGFGEVMKLAAALLSRLLEPHDIGELEMQDARPLEDASNDSSWLGEAPHWCLRFALDLEGAPPAPLLVLIEQAESDASAELPDEELSIVILDPDGAERDRIEELGEEVGRDVAALDPGDFGDDSRESIEEADAVIVAWQLGGRSGLELVEHLVRHERTSDTPVLLAHDRADRAMVESALRAGARGFVLRPYDLAEIEKAVVAAKRGPIRTRA